MKDEDAARRKAAFDAMKETSPARDALKRTDNLEKYYLEGFE
jgi:hypothetical protein